MRLVIAVIPPESLESVKTALADVEVFRITVSEVQGFSATPESHGQETFRGRDLTLNLSRYIQLIIGVNEHFLQPTITAIQTGLRRGPTSTTEDGKIFVLPLDDCIRIRTGERGSEAI
ncbi:MAG: P-II family nitrogen regulator [Thermoguttaceae bacterium]